MKTKKMRLNKKVFLNRVFSLLLCVCLMFLLTGSVVAKDTKPEYKEIVVKHGDTLWGIAKKQYGDQVNIEKAIYHIKKTNQMSKSDLYPGKNLKIPLNL